MDQRILNMTAGQVIEYSRLVSRREELRQFPEEEGVLFGKLNAAVSVRLKRVFRST